MVLGSSALDYLSELVKEQGTKNSLMLERKISAQGSEDRPAVGFISAAQATANSEF